MMTGLKSVIGAEMEEEATMDNAAKMTNTSELDDEEEERLKKQREVKRLFRARRRMNLLSMRGHVRELEKQYRCLYVGNVAQQQRIRSSPSSSELSIQYRQTRLEVEELREQNAMLENILRERERFASLLGSYRIEFMRPRVLPLSFEQEDPVKPVANSFEPLSAEECQRIVNESYQTVFHTRFLKGKCMSSGARVFGWTDERYVDDTVIHYSLEKTYPFVSARHLMEQTWAILTQDDKMRRIYPSGRLQLLQVVNDDMIVVRRRVHYSSLDADVIIDKLVFRMQTEKGYLVGYRSIDPRSWIKNAGKLVEKPDREAPHFVIWHNTLVWQRIDEEDLAETDAMVVDGSGLPSLYPQGASQCRVTCGGRIDNLDPDVAKFFLVEIVCGVIRWDQVVMGSTLCWINESSEASNMKTGGTT